MEYVITAIIAAVVTLVVIAKVEVIKWVLATLKNNERQVEVLTEALKYHKEAIEEYENILIDHKEAIDQHNEVLGNHNEVIEAIASNAVSSSEDDGKQPVGFALEK